MVYRGSRVLRQVTNGSGLGDMAGEQDREQKEMKDKDFIKQQCNYCGHKTRMYGEIIIYVDPYGDAATNYICLDCYVEREKNDS